MFLLNMILRKINWMKFISSDSSKWTHSITAHNQQKTLFVIYEKFITFSNYERNSNQFGVLLCRFRELPDVIISMENFS